MIDQTFKFYLKKDASTYYYVDGGIVLTTTDKREIPDGPDGWADLTMQYVSDAELWGIFRKVALDLRFVTDGATILRSIFYQQKYEGQCIIHIEKLNTFLGIYESWNEGELDFAEINIQKDFVGITILERGLAEFLENKRDVVHEVSLGDTDRARLNVDGLKILNSVSYTPIFFYSGPGQLPASLAQLSRVSDLGKAFMPEQVVTPPNDPSATVSVLQYYFFRASTDGDTANVKIENLSAFSLFGGSLFIYKWDNSATSLSEVWSEDITGGDTIIINEDLAFTLDKDDKLIWVFRSLVGPDPEDTPNILQISDVSESLIARITVSGVIQFTPTKCLSYRYIRYGRKLISQLSGGLYSLESDFLSNTDTSTLFRRNNYDNSPWNTVVTSGDGIRGIAGAVIKGTIGEYLKDCMSRWPVGVGIEGNVLRIEHISYWLNKTNQLFKCELVNNFTIYTAQEYIYNQINVGYGDYQYDQLSGKEEFNAGQTYLATNVKRITKVKEATSPYRADPFGWEYLRNQLSEEATGIVENNTKDNEADNDVFLMEIDPVPVMGYYVPYRPPGIITGLTQVDRIYNLTLSPSRALRRAFIPHLKSFTEGLLEFKSGDKNTAVFSQFSTIFGVIDAGDIDITTGAELPAVQPLYQPYIFEFDCTVFEDLVSLLEFSPKGYVAFDFEAPNGTIQELKGFIIDVGITPATHATYRFKLLSHPDNDLTQLI